MIFDDLIEKSLKNVECEKIKCEKIFIVEQSFNFCIFDDFRSRILDESRSEFSSADNLLKDIDFAEKVEKSEKNDERNWWNKESKSRIEDEKKNFRVVVTRV